MTTKRILISVVWLITPYLIVLALAFLLGVLAATFNKTLPDSIYPVLRVLAGISIFVGAFGAVYNLLNKKEKK